MFGGSSIFRFTQKWKHRGAECRICNFERRPESSKKFRTCVSCFGLAAWAAGQTCSFLHERTFWETRPGDPQSEARWAWVSTQLQGGPERIWALGLQRQLSWWALAQLQLSSCSAPWMNPTQGQEPEPRRSEGSSGPLQDRPAARCSKHY